ncbi:MAG: hypothetical protein KAJ42_14390 [Gemmatimonadetes bacterium]|nr:hypothetical protein [Gemmatimonadota bacterium]
MSNVMALLVGMIGGGVMLVVWHWFKDRHRPGEPVMNSADIVADAVARMVVEQFGDSIQQLQDVETLTQQKLELKSEVERLIRQKDDITADYARKQRELEHAAGLLRKELDAELVRVRAEASHEAESKILEVERTFNKKQMDFAQERFKGELETLNGLVETLTERLPDVSARLRLDGKV